MCYKVDARGARRWRPRSAVGGAALRSRLAMRPGFFAARRANGHESQREREECEERPRPRQTLDDIDDSSDEGDGGGHVCGAGAGGGTRGAQPRGTTPKSAAPAASPASAEWAPEPASWRLRKALHPGDPEATRTYARSLLESGSPEAAAVPLRQLVEAERAGMVAPHAHTHYFLAVALGAMGDEAGALTANERALELKPELLAARRALVPLLANAGRAREALEHATLLTHIALEHQKPGAHYDLGTLLLQMGGRDDDAVKALRAALMLAPTMTEAYVNHDAAMLRVGRLRDCRVWAERCARATGMWAHSPWQRPPHFVPGLAASAWHDKRRFPFALALERHAKTIKRELDALMPAGKCDAVGRRMDWGRVGGRSHADADLVAAGDWREFVLLGGGPAAEAEARRRCPRTHALLSSVVEIAACAATGVGEALFSVLTPGSRLRAHCGSTNVRLTCHLGLQVPEGCHIRCGGEWRQWREGEAMVFDDSFEHQVEHNGDQPRIVLLINFFHPEYPREQWAPVQPAAPPVQA